MDSACAVTNAYYTIAYMPFFRPAISLALVFFLVIPPVGAQTTNFLSRVTNPYRPREVGPVNLSNSNRLERLVRAGILYLSLQDTIALALENNLDIELQRYGAQIADASLLRAKAGGLLRGTTSTVTTGPSSAPTQAGQASGVTGSAATQASNALVSQSSGTVISATGSPIPILDPLITSFVQVGHATNPQTSNFVSGSNTLVTSTALSNVAFTQSFLTGTQVQLSLSNSALTTTALRTDLNPSTSATLGLSITQQLLQGFGVAVNSRNIQIAKNNRELSDLVFKEQVINIISAVINLYWDLVSFTENVKVQQQAVDLNKKLLSDNRKQVEVGTLAPISIISAEAELATAEQALTIAQTRVLQQETILKNALSRNGVASPSISEARIVPTDHILVPQTEAVSPIQDMVAEALRARPDVAQLRIQLTNDKINLRGSKSELLPSLSVTANLSNNALVGQLSTLPTAPGTPVRQVTPFFIGGYDTALGQLFRRNFPNYSAAFQLTVPLRNRSAQADAILDQLTVRQREIAIQQLQNQVRVDVQNALIALQQSRAVYAAAVKTRILREQTLDAEQKKLALGASTIYNVILIQRDLAQSQSDEVNALSAYSKAKVQLDAATGQTLNNNNVSVGEAFRGSVARPPSALPQP
jgi:outer membrane protein TolC